MGGRSPGSPFWRLERIGVVWDALAEETEDGRFDGSILARGHVSPFPVQEKILG